MTTGSWIFVGVLIGLGLVIYIFVRIFRNRTIRRPGIPVWTRRIRWNWKLAGWIFAFTALFLCFSLVKGCQQNNNMKDARESQEKIEEAKARSHEVVLQIPEKNQTCVKEVIGKKSSPLPTKNTGTVSKSLTCGEIAEIQTNKTDYNLLCDVGNPYCIQVSENGQTWHNVLSRTAEPFRFNPSPENLFIRYNGTDTAKIRLVYK